jgi:small conductance mechanosensitive channel
MLLAVSNLADIARWARGDGMEIVLLVLGSLLLTRFVTWLGGFITARVDATASVGTGDAVVRSEAAKHRHALAQVVTWTAIVLIYCITALLVLQRFAVPLTSLVAPATVVGVAVGFGAQRIVQDLLAGFFFIAERQYGYGDVIRIAAPGTTAGVQGTVEELTLRVTRLRTVNGELLILPNGEIRQVTNLSRDWARAVIDVPLPAGSDINRANDVLRAVGERSVTDDRLRPLMLDAPSVMGVESLDVGSLVVRMVVRTLPGKQFEVARELRVRVALALHEAGITEAPSSALATGGARQ